MKKIVSVEKIKPMAGIEPTTSRLLSVCSTAKLHWQLLIPNEVFV